MFAGVFIIRVDLQARVRSLAQGNKHPTALTKNRHVRP